MKLNHINIPVSNVQETKQFLETFFGLECIVQKGEDTFVGMRDEAGTTLAINNFKQVEAVSYPELFHIGFFQDNRDKVDQIHKRLKEAGFEPEDPREEHGSYTFNLKSPAGFMIEVAHDLQTYS